MLFLFFVVEAGGPPDITFMSLLYFLFGLGFWFADVMADSVVAEKVSAVLRVGRCANLKGYG